VSIAVEFLGDGLIGGLLGSGGAEDDAAAEDEGLWGGPSPNERFELPADIGGQVDLGTEGKWHGSLRANREKVSFTKGIMANRAGIVQLLANWRRIYETVI
jgi:hypothetical protein